jgi:hypothetical protein
MTTQAWATAAIVLAQKIIDQRQRDSGARARLTARELRDQAMPLARRLANAMMAELARAEA